VDLTGSCPGLLINKLAHVMALDMDRKLKAHDLTMSQWVLLKQLWQQEGRSQVELQELLGLDGATVTGLVQRMTILGLIQRQPDPDDRRVQRVFLTERGRALEQITRSLESEVNNRALEGFSADERTFFARLLTRALQNCEGGK
jgi:DNA-binding MarR family transcriptional regulator